MNDLIKADQSMSGAIIVEHIIYGASRSEHTELRGVIRLDQSGVKASGEKKRQKREEREHHGMREVMCQNRKEQRSDRIIAESEKSSADQSGASSAVQNNTERGEVPIRERRKTTAGKYMER